MPYSNTPQQSTYRTVQVKFDDTSTLRSPDNAVRRDSHIINFFYSRISQENKTQEVNLKKRPGVVATVQSLNKVSSSDVIRGHYYEEEENIFFWAVRNKVYKYIPNPAGTYTALVCTLATTTGDVGFNVFQESTGDTYILISDGTQLWSQKLRTYPDVAGVAVTDPDLPTPHIPTIIVLDGYVFLAKGNDIYNSDNDVFHSWDPAGFISAEMSYDNIKYLFQNKNYIYAMGYNSTEVFWDASVATGSPLKRQDSGFKSIGYISSYANYGDWHYFVGQEQNDSIAIYKVMDFKMERISNAAIERTIQSTSSTFTSNAPALAGKGTILGVDGHSFYCLYTPEITWLYDVEEHFWYEWRSPTGVFAPEAAWSAHGGNQYLVNAGANTIDILSPVVYNDKGTNFTCSYTTSDDLFGSVNWKTANRISLVADRHQSTGSSIITIQWSDNDWADSATGQRDINVFLNLPKIHRCGRFRNRSFRILYTDNYPLRMKYLELELNIGSH
jgi:hypothetical protein